MVVVKRPRGSALATVLLLALVLFTLAKALIVISHGSGFRSRVYQDKVAAGFALEAAVADARAQLEANVDWVEGFSNKPLLHGPGTYSITFDTTGAPGPGDSVNNLKGTTAVDGPRGPLTVRPGCAELIVTARVGTVTRRADIYLTGTVSSSGIGSGILGSNRMHMRGNVDIRGIADMATGASIDANIHSNIMGAVADVISWQKLQMSDTAVIDGTVSASSSSGTAINMPGASISGGIQTNQPQKPAPNINISAILAANATHPDPAIPSTGSFTLASGDYTVQPSAGNPSGDLVINGDLDLQGARLFVPGKLEINGSLTGEGEVYVGKETRLQGDTRLTGAQGVALNSKGSVELSGFNGTQYLEAYCASDPVAQGLYEQIKSNMQAIQGMIATTPPCDFMDGGPAHSSFEDLLDAMAFDSGDPAGANYLDQLADRLETNQPPGPSRDFVLGKLRELDRLMDQPNGSCPTADWIAGTHAEEGPLYDAMHNDQCVVEEICTVLSQFDYNKLGSSVFQGTIYTNGYIYANNDMVVVGAVWAKSDGTQLGKNIDGVDVEPGDIFLNRGVRLTLNQAAVDALGGAPVTPTGDTTLKSWIEL